MKTIKAAIVGYGRSGSTMHAGGLEGDENFEVVAVCDWEQECCDKAKERFGCNTYTDHREMLAQEELDLVCNITRTDQHVPVTVDCLNAGVNVLVTKPWAIDKAEAMKMVDAEAASGKTLYPWLPARYGCDLRRLKEIIGEGTIGDVFMIRRSVSSFNLRNDWQTEKKYGGGYLLNWGPHIIDPPIILSGSQVDSVHAEMRQINNPGDVEDVFFACIRMKNGCVINAEYTICAEELPAWIVQGSRGTIVVDGKSVKIYKKTLETALDPTKFSSGMGDTEVLTEELTGDVYGNTAEIYAEVADCMLNSRPFSVQSSDALHLTEILDACRESDAGNQVVSLD